MAKQASKPASRAAGRAAGRAKAAPKPSPQTRSSAKGRPKVTAPSPARSRKTAAPAGKKTTASSGVPTKAAKLQAAGKAITSGHGASKSKGAAGRSPSGVKANAPARPRPAKEEPVSAVRGQKKARGAKRVTFDRKTLATIKKSLEDQRKDLIEQLEDIEEAAFSPSQTEASSEAGFDEDYADAGTATFEREKDLSIANNINNLVVKIDKALEKIEQGSYGICENCGQPISADRLKALPHVLLCINCKKAEERR